MVITDQSRDELVRHELVRSLRARLSGDSMLVLLGNAVVLGLVVVLVRDDVHGMRLWAWVALILMSTVLRAAWHRRGTRADVSDRVVLAGTRAVAALQGLCWGVGAAFLAHSVPTAESAVMCAALAGMIGSAMNTLSADAPSFRLFLVGIVAPLTVGLLAAPTDEYRVVMAVLAVLFAGAMLQIHGRVGRGLTNHLRTVILLSASEAQLRETDFELRTLNAAQTKLIGELRAAVANVKTLTGLLPICSNCKKIRDDTGYWGSVERYVSEHTDARFSHGVCPDCYPKLYPGIPFPAKEHV